MRREISPSTLAVLLILSVGVSAFAVGPAAATTPSGDQLATSSSGTFTEESYDGRMYMKYVPSSVDSAEDAPVVVMLHGCQQSPRGFADETKMNQIAEEEGFIVIYPDQTKSANRNQCWNWFEDYHTSRGSGEAALIAGMTEEVIAEHNVDEQRVYLAGFSAGAAMAPNMAAAYPDLYAAVGVASGLEYDAADGQNDAFTTMLTSGGPDPQKQGTAAYEAMGDRANAVPTAVWHGTSDSTVIPLNGNQSAEQAAQTNDLATDGEDDDNINYTAEVTRKGQTEAGVSYTEYEYHNENGVPVVERYIVNGMGHAWAGGSQGGSYTAPDAPDASQRLWNFFTLHTRDQVGGGLNQAPTAEATASSTEVNTSETVTFDASASADSDGNITSYEWDLDGDGTVDATGQQASKTYADGGVYDVELTVTDDDGAVGSDTVSVTVDAPGNNDPSASVSANTTAVTEGNTVSFDASASTDSDGTVESYEWDFDGDGTVDATGQQVTHTYATNGTYDATVTVTDNEGAQATATVTITVEAFDGYCGSAYPYEHEDNGRAKSQSDGSYVAVGSGDDLGYGGSKVTLEETSENYYEKVDSCDGNDDDGGNDGGGDWWWF